MNDLNYLQRVALDVYWEAGGTGDYIPPSEESLYLAYAVLTLAKGQGVTNSDVHNAWSLWATGEGFFQHPSLVPYSRLTAEKQALDTTYREAIHRTSVSLAGLV